LEYPFYRKKTELYLLSCSTAHYKFLLLVVVGGLSLEVTVTTAIW